MSSILSRGVDSQLRPCQRSFVFLFLFPYAVQRRSGRAIGCGCMVGVGRGACETIDNRTTKREGSEEEGEGKKQGEEEGGGAVVGCSIN